MNYKIGVIGDKESVLPFKLFGFSVYFANDESEVKTAFLHLVEKEYGVIYITETCAAHILTDITKLQQKMTPAVVLIPDHGGNRHIAQDQLHTFMKKAAGQTIL